jgi:hypothetical protein
MNCVYASKSEILRKSMAKLHHFIFSYSAVLSSLNLFAEDESALEKSAGKFLFCLLWSLDLRFSHSALEEFWRG